MKISPLIPAGLCVVAGALLAGDALCQYFFQAPDPQAAFTQSKFDVFGFAVGLYFIGKGLFIHLLLDAKGR